MTAGASGTEYARHTGIRDVNPRLNREPSRRRAWRGPGAILVVVGVVLGSVALSGCAILDCEMYSPRGEFRYATMVGNETLVEIFEAEGWRVNQNLSTGFLIAEKTEILGNTSSLDVRALIHPHVEVARTTVLFTMHGYDVGMDLRNLTAAEGRDLLDPRIAPVLGRLEGVLGPPDYVEYLSGNGCREDARERVS